MSDPLYREIFRKFPHGSSAAAFAAHALLCDGSVPLPDGMIAGFLLVFADRHADVMFTLDDLRDHVAECRAAGVSSDLDECDVCTPGIVWRDTFYAAIGQAEPVPRMMI